MQDHNSTLMVSILRRDYPDIASLIEDRINKDLPDERLIDFDLLEPIVSQFKSIFFQYEADFNVHWDQSKNRLWCKLSSEEYRLCKVTEIREMLIAIIIMFYHPERILGLTKSSTKYGIMKHLSNLMNCDTVILSQSLSNSIAYFKTYHGFRNEVLYLYNLIKEKGNYLKNNDNGKEN